MTERGVGRIERAARLLVRLAAVLVPRDQRRDWREEWLGELSALAEARAGGTKGLPGPLAFAAGAVPHATWMRTEGWTVDSMIQDLRYATRVLRRAPGFTLVAALTLALGIGANAAIFSLVNGLVLRTPPAVQAPDRLVQIARSYEDAPRWDNFSWPALQSIRSEDRVFSGVAGYSTSVFTVGQGVDTERVLGQLVTGDYFDVLGVRPQVGRLIQPTDDVEPGAHPVVVLSHGLWERRFGARPEAVGEQVQIGARPYQIIGVTPPGFAGVETIGSTPALFVPTMQTGFGGETLFDQWGSSWIELVGRLAENVSMDQARAAMPLVSTRLRNADPVNEGIQVLLAQGVGLDPEERGEAARITAILGLIVGLVLLLTCTNVANLFLARATARRSEVGVRMAMGAGRGRVVRQLVTESALMALLATVLAIPIVVTAGDLLPALFPYELSVSVGADARVYGFLVIVGLSTGLLFGAAPAWVVARRDVAATLREGASTGGAARTRMRDVLVVSQLGLSLGLVAGAALLGKSVQNARSADPGYEPAGLIAGTLNLFSSGRYDDPAAGEQLYRAVLAEAEALPGVLSATLANQMPLTGGHSRATVRPAGRQEPSFEAEYVVVGPRYFETMGIPILRGRALGGFDDETERVVVVNEALAAMYWPGEEAVGQELDGSGATWRVVGVSGDVQMRTLRARANPAVYYPAALDHAPFMALHMRTIPRAGVEPAAVRRVVAAVDPQLPVGNVVDLGGVLSASMGETRTFGWLVTSFAVLALILATVGLYGLVSYGAAQRVREMGIRIALGAEPGTLVRLVLARAVGIAVLGAALGLVVAWGMGAALSGLLFGVEGSDPFILGGAVTLLLAAAGMAAWVPARRASHLDAVVSLRQP